MKNECLKEALKQSLCNLFPLSQNEKHEIFKWLENDEKEIERLNKGLEYIELYWSNREEYEKNELLRQIRDKDTSIEWLERAIEEEKKRERLY